MFVEFPKSLYRGDQLPSGDYPEHLIVSSAEEEAGARLDGWRMLTDPPAISAVPQSDNSNAEQQAPKKRGRPRKE